eukprot:gene4044-2896_t
MRKRKKNGIGNSSQVLVLLVCDSPHGYNLRPSLIFPRFCSSTFLGQGFLLRHTALAFLFLTPSLISLGFQSQHQAASPSQILNLHRAIAEFWWYMSVGARIHRLWALAEELQRDGQPQIGLLYLLGALQHPERVGVELPDANSTPVPPLGNPSPRCPPRDMTAHVFPPYLRAEELRTRLKASALLLDEVESMNAASEAGQQLPAGAAEEALELASLLLAPLFVSPRPFSVDVPGRKRSRDVEDGWSSLTLPELDSALLEGTVRPRRAAHTVNSGFLSLQGESFERIESDYFFNPACTTALAWRDSPFVLHAPLLCSEPQLFHAVGCKHDSRFGNASTAPHGSLFGLLVHTWLAQSRLLRLQKRYAAALSVLQRAQTRLVSAFDLPHWRHEKHQLEAQLEGRLKGDPAALAQVVGAVNQVWDRAMDTLWSHEKQCAQLLLAAEHCQVLSSMLRHLSRQAGGPRPGESAAAALMRRQRDQRTCVQLLERRSAICLQLDKWFRAMRAVIGRDLAVATGTVPPEQWAPQPMTDAEGRWCDCARSRVVYSVPARTDAPAASTQLQVARSSELLLQLMGCLDPACLASWQLLPPTGAGVEAEAPQQPIHVYRRTAVDAEGMLRQVAFFQAYAVVLSLVGCDVEPGGSAVPLHPGNRKGHAAVNAVEQAERRLQACAAVGSTPVSHPPNGDGAPDELELLRTLFSLCDYGSLPPACARAPSGSAPHSAPCDALHWTSAAWRRLLRDYSTFVRTCATLRTTGPAELCLQRFSSALDAYGALLRAADEEIMTLSSGTGADVEPTTGPGREATKKEEAGDAAPGPGNTALSPPISRGGDRRCRAPRLPLLSFLLSIKSCVHLAMAGAALRLRCPLECAQCLVEWRHCVLVFAGTLAPLRAYGHMMIALLATHLGLTDVPLRLQPLPAQAPRSVVAAAHEALTAGPHADVDAAELAIAQLVGLPYFHLLAAESSVTGPRSAEALSISATSPALWLRLQLLKLFTIYLTASTRARVSLCESAATAAQHAPQAPLAFSAGRMRVCAHADLNTQRRCQHIFRNKIALLLESLQRTREAEGAESQAVPLDLLSDPADVLERLGATIDDAPIMTAPGAWTAPNRCLIYLLHGLYALSEDHDPCLAGQEFKKAAAALTRSDGLSSLAQLAWGQELVELIRSTSLTEVDVRTTAASEGAYETALQAAVAAAATSIPPVSPPPPATTEDPASAHITTPCMLLETESSGRRDSGAHVYSICVAEMPAQMRKLHPYPSPCCTPSCASCRASTDTPLSYLSETFSSTQPSTYLYIYICNYVHLHRCTNDETSFSFKNTVLLGCSSDNILFFYNKQEKIPLANPNGSN